MLLPDNFENEISSRFYDKEITVEFIKFIRPEKKFGSLDELKDQIQKDLMEIED